MIYVIERTAYDLYYNTEYIETGKFLIGYTTDLEKATKYIEDSKDSIDDYKIVELKEL